MKRAFIFLYGLIAYVFMLVTIGYLIAFVGNFLVPVTIDGEPTRPFMEALLINLGLIGLFALQHSLMARRRFKDWWEKVLPKAMDRSTYVLATCACLLLLFKYWEPLGGTIWEVQNEIMATLLYTLFFIGWSLMLISTFLISHWDLFGLRQVYLNLVHRPYTALDLKKPLFYKKIRHPLYLGLLIGIWFTPYMTVTHFVFSLAMTAYVLMGIKLEEKDLVRDFGERYIDYRRKVPTLLPFRFKKPSTLRQSGFSRDTVQPDRN